jgi:predicted acylesterase/phospholipase RssA
MTIDVLLASACLPQLFQAVEIEGEWYWDGGYSGNPTLWPLIGGGAARDLIVVQLTPDDTPQLPKDAASIRRRIGEIVFHSSLVSEMQAIAAMRTVATRGAAWSERARPAHASHRATPRRAVRRGVGARTLAGVDRQALCGRPRQRAALPQASMRVTSACARRSTSSRCSPTVAAARARAGERGRVRGRAAIATPAATAG